MTEMVKLVLNHAATRLNFNSSKEYLANQLDRILQRWLLKGVENASKLEKDFPTTLVDCDTWESFANNYSALLASQMIVTERLAHLDKLSKTLHLATPNLVWYEYITLLRRFFLGEEGLNLLKLALTLYLTLLFVVNTLLECFRLFIR